MIYLFYRALLMISLGCSVRGAIISVDDFQDDSLGGWEHGRSDSPNPPIIREDSGPDEDGDDAMENRSSGVGMAGSRFAVLNQSDDWTGSYSGIGGFSMDVLNEGDENRFLRVGIDGPGGRFVSAQAVSRFFGGSWTTFEFSFASEDMVSVSNTDNLAATLAEVTQIRIVANVDGEASWMGVRDAFALSFDNITLVAVPEPSASTLLAGAVVMVLLRRQRKVYDL